MDKGTYAAASAGMLQLTKLDLINNNLANINTPGFKGQYLISEQTAFEDTLAGQINNERMPYASADHDRVPGVSQVRSMTDFTPGPIQNTGNDLHVALRDSKEFFVLNGPDGPLYSRAGNFTLNEEGTLVTHDGVPISGDGDDITVEGGRAVITSGGFVQVDGESVARVQIVRIENPNELERVAGSRFRPIGAKAADPQVVEEPSVIPRSLEMANFTATQSMVDLITASRAFELYTKSAKSIDSMNEQAIQKVGKKA